MAFDITTRRDHGRRDDGRSGSEGSDSERSDTERRAMRESQLRGLDALDLGSSAPPLAHAVWRSAWPKFAALGISLGLWQLVAISGVREDYVLPGPAPVLVELSQQLGSAELWKAVGITMTRGVIGFAISAVLGLLLGVLVARSRILRAAIGSLITGLQTMPSIAWFPLAILLFQMSEQAILFVILIGAVPSIANGVIGGVDYVPSLLVRAGRNVGASGLSLYRHVILPAALPSIVTGLKQGWAFAWRSLLAGELLVSIANRPSLGQFLSQSRELSDTEYMISLMIVILAIGLAVDAVFGRVERGIRRRRGVVVSG
jgi:NitT/TauT family transport system permease protein